MSEWGPVVGKWFIEFQVSSAVVLICGLLGLRLIAQPAKRMAVAWACVATTLCLAASIVIPCGNRFSVGLIQLEHATEAPVVLTLASSTGDIDNHRSAGSQAAGAPAATNSSTLADSQYDTLALVLTGVVCCGVAWVLYGWLGLARLYWCSCLPEDWLLKLLDNRKQQASASSELSLLRRYLMASARVRVSDRIEQPVAFGTLRPVVLLPKQLTVPSHRAEVSVALDHELAHVYRGDLWLIAAVRWLFPVLCLNPFYWILRNRIRWDQEVLVDATVCHWCNPVEYAQILLRWARNTGPAASVSLAMAQRGEMLRHRVVHLLDSGSVSTGSSCCWKSSVATAALLGAGFLSSLSIVELRRQAIDPENRSIRLAEGVELEWVAVRHADTERVFAPVSNVDEGSHLASELILRVKNPNHVPLAWPAGIQVRELNAPDGTLSTGDQKWLAIGLPDTEDMQLQLGLGSWRTLAGSGCLNDLGYKYCLCSPAEGQSVLHLSNANAEQDLRIIAVDHCDREICASQSTQTDGALVATFHDLDAEEIREFYLQSRPRQSIHLQNIARLVRQDT